MNKPVNMSFRLLLFGLVLVSATTFAQTGYKIDFKIKGIKDTTALLAYYNGEQTYLKDTAKVDSKGAFTFDGSKPLQQGVFMVVLDKTPLFQFIIGQGQRFMLETSTDDYNAHMVVTGDEDNKLFFEHANFLASKFKKAEPLIKILRDSTLKEDAKKEAREEYTKFTRDVQSYQKDLIAKHPTTLTARLVKSTHEIEVPAPPKKADGTIDSTWQFRYYREHYFDNFDLADDALFRLPKPVYQEKVKDYLDRLFLQDADTLTKEIVRLAARVKKNPESYKNFVWTCLIHYQQPKIMGLDRVYVNIFDKFIATGEMDFWLDPSSKKNIKEYVDKLRLNLIGNTAANLIMQDQNLKPRSMYDIKNKYTIIWFFDPDCGHCKEETPKLVEFYNKSRTKYDFEVYAISIDTSLVKMKTFIKEMKTPWTTVNGPRTYVGHWSKFYYADTTPTMYVIDAKHKVIAKKLPIEQLAEFFEKYEQMMRAKPNGNKGT